MLRAKVWLLAAAGLTLFIFSPGGPVTDFGQTIPKTIGDWTASGPDRTFNRQTIYSYMDGGAEVYLAFDLRQIWSRKYAGPGGRELTLDIFDMSSPEEAFGALSCDREDPPAGVGQESTYGGGLLRLWQGRYFVSVTSSSGDESDGRAALDLGREVVKHLGPAGAKPEMVGFLPEASLRPARTSYFHGAVNLNNRFFVSGDNILHLDRSTDCVFAEYDAEAGEAEDLLLVRYPDAGKAAAARQSFLAGYLPEAGAEGLAQAENKKWVLAALHGNFLAVVFEAASPDGARKLVAAVKFPEK